MIGATPEGSYAQAAGRKAVRVGIIDTGIEGSHPGHRAELQPPSCRATSRSTSDRRRTARRRRAVREEADQSCADGRRRRGRPRHARRRHDRRALNGVGIAGVAPKVELVNLRAGQDSGYFFLQPTVDALTYAGDNGIDVVNMCYYIDPWLYNCATNPADSPAEQEAAAARSSRPRSARCDYARNRGVTLVVGRGQRATTDLGKPEFDDTSPDYPPAAGPRDAHGRQLVPEHADRGQAASSASPRSARASARRSTPTTASSRPTCRRRAATRATPRRPAPGRTGSSRRIPSGAAECAAALCRQPGDRRSRGDPSRRTRTSTGAGCRARRWPRRTRSASRR